MVYARYGKTAGMPCWYIFMNIGTALYIMNIFSLWLMLHAGRQLSGSDNHLLSVLVLFSKLQL